MSVLRKAAAFLTAAGIGVSCASCGYNTVNALTVDGMDIPAGVYIYYANSAYNEATSKLKEEHEDLDTSDEKAVKALPLEGKDVTTWIQDKATEQCAEFAVIEKKFDELGLSFDEATQTNLDMMKEYYWSANQEVMEKNGISADSFYKVMTSSYKSNEIFKHYYAVGGENGTTEEEAYNYYKENNIRCEYLSMSLKDGEGNLLKSDGKKVIMDMAKDYQKRVEKALKSGGEDAVNLEMAQIREDYQAYVDSLTSVKNKHAYEDTAKYIDTQIRNGTAEFAVIMCDLNYLKHINDNLGHKAGDAALQKAANIICTAFPMSTVFRIGGDEFVVIPSVLEYARIEERLDNLKMMLRDQKQSSDNFLERISIAFGCAVFDREKDRSFQDVFERADMIMYEEKKKIHESDGIMTERFML